MAELEQISEPLVLWSLGPRAVQAEGEWRDALLTGGLNRLFREIDT
jgi:hypothetical protein